MTLVVYRHRLLRRILYCNAMAAAGAREPTPEEIAGWNGMADVALWANLKGDALDPATQAGSLLLATDAVEDGELCSIAEFAAMDPDSCLESILGWTYCDGTGATVQPGPVFLGKARSMFRGGTARCRCRLDKGRLRCLRQDDDGYCGTIVALLRAASLDCGSGGEPECGDHGGSQHLDCSAG